MLRKEKIYINVFKIKNDIVKQNKTKLFQNLKKRKNYNIWQSISVELYFNKYFRLNTDYIKCIFEQNKFQKIFITCGTKIPILPDIEMKNKLKKNKCNIDKFFLAY